MIETLVRIYKKAIVRNAEKYDVGVLVAYAIGGAFGLLVLPYMTLHLYHDAYGRDAVYEGLAPEVVVKQWVETTGANDKTSVELLTASGVHLSLGKHTPNYLELERAVKEQRPLKVWWHIFEYKPRFLAVLAQTNDPRVFQVSDDVQPIVSFSELKKYWQDGYYIIIIFAVMLLGLVTLMPVIVGAAFVKLRRSEKPKENY